MKKTTKILACALLVYTSNFISNDILAQRNSDFENLSLEPNSFWNGSDGTKKFQSGEVLFNNSYNDTWASWTGFAFSNQKNTTTVGIDGQYSSYAGGGVNGSSNYGISFSFGENILRYTETAKKCKLKGMYVSNNTYTASDMKNGSKFSKKFGGNDGNEPDSLILVISNYNNGEVKNIVKIYLADYRFTDNSKDYILDKWMYVDMSKFDYSDSLSFGFISSDAGSFGINTPTYFCFDNIQLIPAPFAGIAGSPSSTAISKDSPIIKNWANSIEVQRGYQNIALPESGFASFGEPENATGKAGEKGLVSLGDGGVATLSFPNGISNDEGADFAVFENSFSDTFLELAFVEVSSDGDKYFRFPAVSYTDTTVQTDGFGNTDCKMIHNLAGKYKANFGTPFDLEELKGKVGLDINNIKYVRIIDVVGSIISQYAQRDMLGQMINDPWPTPFASSGFDLDAVGVINEALPNAIELSKQTSKTLLYPNPAKIGMSITIANHNESYDYQIINAQGQTIQKEHSNQINTDYLKQGMYWVEISGEFGKLRDKIVIE
ncbi:MAG: DUF4465 domain-containing protein [Cytophagales bacterium]|nr:MAG: DUF4465 domain-containing protein [Cytophagales bacterium]